MITLEQVSKSYGEQKVLKNINLTINKGDVVVVCGPSGSGKSTAVKAIIGLDSFEQGDIKIDGKSIKLLANIERARKIGMVFQAFALFPNMTVLENITVALINVLGISKVNAEEEATKQLSKLKISNLKNAKPYQLSGGQMQRVAIARTLAMKPEYIIFDEATSGLDPEMVSEFLEIIEYLVVTENLTAIVVTHEMGFAKKVANRVVFMEDGAILEDTSSEQFFTKPKTARAIQFLKKVIR